jgi:hypothetical protein
MYTRARDSQASAAFPRITCKSAAPAAALVGALSGALDPWVSKLGPRVDLPGFAGGSSLRTPRVAPLSAGGTVYSDEREILDAERDYWQPRVAVHFGAKLLQWAMFDLGQGTARVLVVLNPTARKQTLRALDMRATVDREEFFQFQHGDGRLKLIERLAAAHRAGELPDYMLEFVDSLRTRATPATS